MTSQEANAAQRDSPTSRATRLANQRRRRDEQKSYSSAVETPGGAPELTASDSEDAETAFGDRGTDIPLLKRALREITVRGVQVATVARTIDSFRREDIDIVVVLSAVLLMSNAIVNVSRFQAGVMICRHSARFVQSEAFIMACRFQEMKEEVLCFFFFGSHKRLLL